MRYINIRIRILAICLIFLFGACSVTAFAVEKSENNDAFHLLALNILEPEQVVNNNKLLTRGEFLRAVMHLSGMYANESDNYDYEIKLAYELGIITGYSTGDFGADDFIRAVDALKILLNALGYSSVAAQYGGYPDGYILCAVQRVGIDCSACDNFEKPLQVGQAIQILDSALDAHFCVKEIGTQDSYVEQNSTVRSNLCAILGLSYGEGRVDSSYDSEELREVNLRSGEVTIDGKRFFAGESGAEKLLGYYTEYYFKVDGFEEITAIQKNGEYREISVNGKDADKISDNTFYYYYGDQIKKLQLSDTLELIYNGKIAPKASLSDFLTDTAKIKFLDWDGKNGYDTIFIEDFHIAFVKRTDVVRKVIYLHDNKKLPLIKLEKDESDFSVILQNDNGDNISLEDIKSDDSLAVYTTADGEVIKVCLITNSITGSVNRIGKEDGEIRVTINDSVYSLYEDNDELLKDIKLGANGTFFIDFNGRIVCFEEQSDSGTYTYGFVQAVSKSNSLNDDISLRLIIGGIVKEIEEDTDENGMIDTRYLEISNSDIRIHSVAQRVKLNGIHVESDKLMNYISADPKNPSKNSVILYKTNTKNEICEIEIAQPLGVTANRTLNVRDRLFGGTVGGAFVMDEDTRLICIPKTESEFNEDSYHTVNQLEDEKNYEILGFDVDDETRIAKAAVILTTDNSAAAGINNLTKASIAGNITEVLDDNGDSVSCLEGYTASNLIKVFGDSDSNINRLERGDLFYYATDYKGYINEIEIIKKRNELKNYFYYEGERTEAFGKAEYVKTNYVSDTATGIQDMLILDVGDETVQDLRTFYYSVNQKPPVYIYEKKRNIVYVGTADDIRTVSNGEQNPSDVYISMRNAAIKVILIINE